jgi:hypothetical protein
MVISPRQRAVTRVGALDLLDVHEHRAERVHRTGDEHRRVLIRQRHRMLCRQLVGVVGGIEGEQSRRGLAVEPFSDQSRVAVHPCNELV